MIFKLQYALILKGILFTPAVGLFTILCFKIITSNVNHIALKIQNINILLLPLLLFCLLQIAITKKCSLENKISIMFILSFLLLLFAADHYNLMLHYEEWCKRGMLEPLF